MGLLWQDPHPHSLPKVPEKAEVQGTGNLASWRVWAGPGLLNVRNIALQTQMGKLHRREPQCTWEGLSKEHMASFVLCMWVSLPHLGQLLQYLPRPHPQPLQDKTLWEARDGVCVSETDRLDENQV